MAKKPDKIGQRIDALAVLRTAAAIAQFEADTAKGKFDAAAEVLLAQMLELKMEKASGSDVTVSVSDSVIPMVKDWAAVWAFAKRTDAPDLFEKRIAVRAWRDRLESAETRVPGIEPLLRRRLLVRER
jgi:hypothetical protein